MSVNCVENFFMVFSTLPIINTITELLIVY